MYPVSLEWRDNALHLLDQRILPHTIAYLTYHDHHAVAEAIRTMVVRGAPAIGAAAAYGLALAAQHSPATTPADLLAELRAAGATLKAARPTAVNLFWAVDTVLARVSAADSVAAMRVAALNAAHAVAEEDRWANRQMGLHALPLIPDTALAITHCNAGGLATVDYGTAVGVIRAAHEHGKHISVLVDETRPRLQGAKLTAFELRELGIPHQVIVDGASGHFMRTRKVDFCVVGCDRVAANGDTANKIGTYNLALAAKAHGVPFYVAAPTSTIDLTLPHGDAIHIEERDPDEVRMVGAEPITAAGVLAANPAFDVTPAAYITAFITEFGVVYPPFADGLRAVVAQAQQRRAGA